MALRSGSPIHFQPVEASGLAFAIGSGTSTYCPTSVPSCASLNSNVTALYGGGSAMYVEVPGGQQVYAAADGALGYTQAHSATVGGGNQTAPSDGQSFGYWTWSGADATGLVACPSSGSGNQGTGPWKVYAAVPGKDFGSCLGFAAAAIPYDGTYAWQYT